MLNVSSNNIVQKYFKKLQAKENVELILINSTHEAINLK